MPKATKLEGNILIWKMLYINCGSVAQSSILLPLLFLIYFVPTRIISVVTMVEYLQALNENKKQKKQIPYFSIKLDKEMIFPEDPYL